jgi:CelD/BcsL family acetyltransferase involved in cellulose biosynthesis
MNHDLRVEVVDSTDALDAIRPDWEALYARATGGTNPFLRWIWVREWWRNVSRRPWLPRTELRILAMRDQEGHLQAVVPFFQGTWQLGPLIFRALRLYGFHTTLTDIRTVLVAPGREIAAADGVLAALGTHRRQYHVCILDGLEPASAFTVSVTSSIGRHARRGPELLAYILRLPGSWDELRARLTRNNRGSIQQGYNALNRDRRKYAFEVITRPADLPAALDELFALHAARAAYTAGPRHHDYYASAHDRAFLRDVTAALAAEDLVRVCRLRVDGRVVASRVVLAAGPGSYLYHAGHDPAWDHYRVGTVLTAECVQMAIRAGHRFVHFGTGTEPSKLRWSPDLQRFEQLHIAAPTPAGELLSDVAWQLVVAARRLRERWPQHRWLTVGGLELPRLR